MPNIFDVARQAGVSTTTVSHVLNRTRYVSPELTQRVLRVVDTLGFRPSFVARSLRAGRTQSVGLVVSDVLNPFFTQVTRAIEDRLRPAGYSVIICSTDEDPAVERSSLQVLADKQVDGIILAPTAGDHRFLAALSRKIPVVLINREVPGPALPRVTTDNRGGARLAVEHLITHGHRRIGMILGLRALSTSRDRLAGYADALRAARIPVDTTLVAHGGSTAEGAEAAMQKLFASRRRPTAIFVGSVGMTVGVLQCLHRWKVGCPGEVAVVGFTDFPWCQVTNPPLSCVRQPVREIGEAAADLLLRSLRGELLVPSPAVVVSPSLTVRESCGCHPPVAPMEGGIKRPPRETRLRGRHQ